MHVPGLGINWVMLVACGLPGAATASDLPAFVGREEAPLYTTFHNHDFPFFEATLDLRSQEHPRNVLPRAIVVPLAHDHFVAFDTELLRVGAIWRGDFPTLKGLAPTSYADPLLKAPGGFEQLSRPSGELIHVTGRWPGWPESNEVPHSDPRPRGVDPNQLGRGPLESARWIGTTVRGPTATLHYRWGDTEVREVFQVQKDGPEVWVRRHLQISPGTRSLNLALGTADIAPIKFEATTTAQEVAIDYRAGRPSTLVHAPWPSSLADRPLRRWPQTMVTELVPGKPQGAFAVDELTMPYPNIWQRRIRPADIDFADDGTAWIVTFDGDVYRLTGLAGAAGSVEWQRVAAGFNEPMSIRVRGKRLYVLSRGGLTELIDENHDGEIDFYQLFSNAHLQSPGGRGFVFGLEDLPDGGFLISTGGQQMGARSPHSGRILRIAPDGRKVDVIASGFRNPWVSRDPVTGLVAASDQQGNWVVSTPFHVIEPGQSYGHEPSTDLSPHAVTAPHLWLPYLMTQSGVGMVMGFDARAGALAGACLYLDYQKPRALRVNLPAEDDRQTSATALPLEFEVPLLKGSINPQDGWAYLVGFQIWDSNAPRLEGLCRLRPLPGALPGPRAAYPFKEGILLTYPEPAEDEVFEIRAWNYRRTENYGSPQFRMNGEPGFDELAVHTVLRSANRKSVFLAIADLPMAATIVVTTHGRNAPGEIYTTANQLRAVDLSLHEIEPVDFPTLFARPATAAPPSAADGIVNLDRGQALVTRYGCTGCHSLDGNDAGKSGPTWHRLFGQRQTLTDGTVVRVDREYLQESILHPTARIPRGYDHADAGMPSYLGVLSASDLDSVILYIESLR